MRRIVHRLVLAAGVLLLAAQAGAAGLGLESRDFARAGAAVPLGSHLRLENVQIADTGESAAFELERFQVFASDAKITIHGRRGAKVVPAPANAYFRGTLEGKPDSRVFLALLADGNIQGLVSDADQYFLIGADASETKVLGAPMRMQRVDSVALKAARGQGFNCANEDLPRGLGTLAGLDPGAPAPEAKSLEKATVAHTARVAIESDFEFLQLFGGNTTNATNYVGNLIGFASTVYVAEISTSLVVQSVSLWTTSGDPWTQTDTFCGLMEFGRFWNVNKTGVSRTIAHFLSGKSNGGGIAWLGVLCGGPFATGAASSCPGLGSESTPWGGAYGFTGNLFGNFNISNPTVVWDIVAVTHEIGHNFNSPHTHCYNGIGGSTSPVDQCRSGEADGHGACYSGTQTLPGPGGAGSGTIMSYCHLLSPGMSNISMSFGTNFGFGVQPGRVPARMNAHVNSVAAANAACLAPVASSAGIFADGFEGGALPGAWSGGKTP